MSKQWKDIDKGWSRIQRQLRQNKNVQVKVGIQSNSGYHREGDVPLTTIAAVNEFGSSDGVIPERSFIRSTIDENQKKYLKWLKKAASDLMGPIAAVHKAFDVIGLKVASDMKRTMTQLKSPPNAPSTMKAKRGVNNPLVDTGQLRNSITHVVD